MITSRRRLNIFRNRALGVLILVAISFLFLGASPAFHGWAPTPPMGWNSWDCFGAGVNEEQTLANADYMEKNLKSHGWNIITIDIQWYEPLAHTTEYRKGAAMEMDANGRLLPAPNRFAMTKESRSFKPMADALHSKGLKFGLHLLRGVPRQAVDRDNSQILGTNFHAADIADKINHCRWNGDMWGVDMSKSGAQEYYDSVFALLAAWEIDFVKVDDLAGHQEEIEAIRKSIDKTGRPIILSVSPGPMPFSGAILLSAMQICGESAMTFGIIGIRFAQFARIDRWTPVRGAGHWPDADMLPLGNVRAWQEKDNWTNFTHDEQFTLMTLWSISRSPLIMGGNMPKNDAFTLSLMTNDEVIAVDQNSTNNKQLTNRNDQVIWEADVPATSEKYVAFFNTSSSGAKISVALNDLGLTGPCKIRDLWAQKDIGVADTEIAVTVNSHGAVLYRVQKVR